MRIIIYLILFIIIPSVLIADEGDVVWTRTHGGGNNFGRGIAIDSSDNVYIIGDERRIGEDRNIWIRKYDSSGNTIWTRIHNSSESNSDYGYGIAVDTSGNVYVTGREMITGLGFNIWIRKYNADGSTNWTRTHNGSTNKWDYGHDIAVDSSGNVYVVGSEYITGETYNIWIRKYNADGSTNWTRTHNSPGINQIDEGHGIAVDSSGNVYVTGSENLPSEFLNIWIRKYDTDGNTNWTRTYNGVANSRDTGHDIAVDSSGNVYVTGFEEVTGEDENIWIRKYDSIGNTIWTRTHNGSENAEDEGRGIALDLSGNVYITGYEHVTGERGNIWVRKYSANGDTNWTRTFHSIGSNHEESYGIAVDTSGNVYVTGYVYITNEGCNVWVRKYSCDIDITNTSLPIGQTGQTYSANLGAVGGATPHTWTIISGLSGSGLTLQLDGTLNGTFNVATNISFTVQVEEALGGIDVANFTINTFPGMILNSISSTTNIIILNWTNPVHTNFAGIRIVRKIGSYPSSTNDGYYTNLGTSVTAYTDIGLTNNTKYYYKIYTYNVFDNYSVAISVNISTKSPGPDFNGGIVKLGPTTIFNNENLYFANITRDTKVSIYDVKGRLLWSADVTDTYRCIPQKEYLYIKPEVIEDLVDGLYIIVFKDDKDDPQIRKFNRITRKRK